jgi:hypothetical protein
VGFPILSDKAYVAVSVGWSVYMEVTHIVVSHFVVLGRPVTV